MIEPTVPGDSTAGPAEAADVPARTVTPIRRLANAITVPETAWPLISIVASFALLAPLS